MGALVMHRKVKKSAKKNVQSSTASASMKVGNANRKRGA